MTADAGFRDHVMDILAPLGSISSRSMFGGYGIFAESDMFALISGSEVFFKVDASNIVAYEEAGSKKYGPMPYYRVPTEVLENSAKLLDWARTSISIARSAAKKKRR